MFNSFKNEPDQPNSKSTEVASAVSAGRDKSPASYVPSGASASSSKSSVANHSIVDENLTMKGDLESEGDILVKGKVIGNITCNLLIIDRDAFVEGGIHAAEVIVRGRVKGKVDADKVRLERSADVDCDIVQRSFSAEEGARIKGSLGFKTDAAGAVGSNVARIDASKAGGAKADGAAA